MTTSSAETAQRRLQTVGRRYRRRGYRVLLRPRGTDLPPFLARFEPDMIAYKDDDAVVVEVKSRAEMRASDNLIDLTDAVNAQQGWRLDLAVINPTPPPLVDENAETMDPPEIVARDRAVRRLVTEGQDEAAILLAWSAVEAALRLVAAQQDVALESDQPAYIVERLYTLGVLSREEYEGLYKGLRAQTLLVHGFRLPKPEAHLAAALLDHVDDLLHTRAAGLTV